MQFKTVPSDRRVYKPLTISKKDIESDIKSKARELIKKDWVDIAPFTTTKELRIIFAGKKLQSSVEVHFSKSEDEAPDKKYTIMVHIEYDNHKTVPIGVGHVTSNNELSFDLFNALS
jgi:hypothetical protein